MNSNLRLFLSRLINWNSKARDSSSQKEEPRIRLATCPKIIELSPSTMGSQSDGSIIVCIGPPDSDILSRMRGAAESSNHEALRSITKCASGRSSWDTANADLITELYYFDRRIVEAGFAHRESPAGSRVFSFPYHGGDLNQSAFQFVRSFRREERFELQSLVVIQHPRLAPIEEKLSQRIPDDLNTSDLPELSRVGLIGKSGWAAGKWLVRRTDGPVESAPIANERDQALDNVDFTCSPNELMQTRAGFARRGWL